MNGKCDGFAAGNNKDFGRAPKKHAKTNKTVKKILTGALAGTVNGLFGGGGGMIVVPALKYLLDRKTETAHATAIAVILPLSVLSGIFYAAFGKVMMPDAVYVTLGVTAGGVVGAFLLKRLSAKPITLIFSAVMAVAGVKMLFF